MDSQEIDRTKLMHQVVRKAGTPLGCGAQLCATILDLCPRACMFHPNPLSHCNGLIPSTSFRKVLLRSLPQYMWRGGHLWHASGPSGRAERACLPGSTGAPASVPVCRSFRFGLLLVLFWLVWRY